jgi:hypothetical protein
MPQAPCIYAEFQSWAVEEIFLKARKWLTLKPEIKSCRTQAATKQRQGQNQICAVFLFYDRFYQAVVRDKFFAKINILPKKVAVLLLIFVYRVRILQYTHAVPLFPDELVLRHTPSLFALYLAHQIFSLARHDFQGVQLLWNIFYCPPARIA